MDFRENVISLNSSFLPYLKCIKHQIVATMAAYSRGISSCIKNFLLLVFMNLYWHFQMKKTLIFFEIYKEIKTAMTSREYSLQLYDLSDTAMFIS